MPLDTPVAAIIVIGLLALLFVRVVWGTRRWGRRPTPAPLEDGSRTDTGRGSGER